MTHTACKLIPLAGKYGEGKFAKVSPEDYHGLKRHRWYLRSDGYVWRPSSAAERRSGRTCTILMHQEVARAMGVGMVDHRDGDPSDNRRGSLRPASTLQNNRNIRKQQRRKGTISRFKGVSRPRRGRWIAYIRVSGTLLQLGRFDEEVDAARAYNAAALKHFGDFARLNEVG